MSNNVANTLKMFDMQKGSKQVRNNKSSKEINKVPLSNEDGDEGEDYSDTSRNGPAASGFAPDEGDADTHQRNPEVGTNKEENPAASGMKLEEIQQLIKDNEIKEKRYKDLQSWSHKEIESLKKEIAELKSGMSLNNNSTDNAGQTKVEATNEALETIRKNNPKLYEAVSAIVKEQTRNETRELKQLSEKNQSELQEMRQARSLREVVKEHSDALEIRDDPRFLEWLSNQTRVTQAQFGPEATPSDIIEGLYKYKKAVGIKTKQDKKQAQKDAATDVSVNSPTNTPATANTRVWKESDIQALSSAEYDLYEAEIDAALAQGKVILDISNRKG